MGSIALPAKPLVVILGLGGAGTVHAEAFSRDRRIRLGLASHRPDALATVSSTVHPDRTYCHYDAVFEDPDVVAVVITSHWNDHPRLIRRAAHANKHVLCEKPIGPSVPDVLDALAAAKNASTLLAIGFMRRFDPAYSASRARVARGELGDVVLLKCTSGDQFYPCSHREQGMGEHSLIKEIGAHDVDLARWFARAEVASVYALEETSVHPHLRPQSHDGDVVFAVLHMTNGVKVTVHLAWAMIFGYCVCTEVVCKEGSLRIGDLGHTDVDVVAKGSTQRDVDPDYKVRFRNAFENQASAFIDLLCEKDLAQAEETMRSDDRFASGVDGLHNLLVVQAIVKSIETGMPVDVVYSE